MAAIDVVPETLRVVTSVIAPPKTALPVIVSALVPPAMVELVVIVVPWRVRSPPESVTAPV